MSDDDFLNTPLESFTPTESDTSESDQEDLADNEVNEQENSDDQESTEELENSEEDENNESKEEEEETEDTETTEEDVSVEQSEEEPAEKTKEELAKLFAPFKANGKEIKVNSVDEAIQLMQMGANYTKKMTALKPVMKVARMLENNGLMDEQQVSFLIDLSKKNPEAIAKLLKDSELNPLEIDIEKGLDYKGGEHIIDDAQIKVEEILETIKETPTYSRTINVVSKEWDNSSRQIIAENPDIIADINQHMQEGIYDMIQQEMDRQRLFGGLKGLSDIAAYKAVGDMLNAQGKFDKASDQSLNQNQEVKPKTNSETDPKIKAKKQAAGITRETKTVELQKDNSFSPLSMSDEEFEKMFGNKL
jgi:hypothetical protein